ncbi:hypothetical protein EKA14_26865 [Bacillus mycoides]|nr:hypothetical protein EKA14_26865 [Bacillus mycoides]
MKIGVCPKHLIIIKNMSIETGLIFVRTEGIVLDITQSVARIVVNGKDLPFTSVQTSAWNHGPVNDLIVSTNQRVNELYQFMWSQVPVTISVYFLQGADLMRFARIAGINERVTGEYIYHFIWG